MRQQMKIEEARNVKEELEGVYMELVVHLLLWHFDKQRSQRPSIVRCSK